MNKTHSSITKAVVMLIVALPLAFSSCSLQNYYAASKCQVSLPGNGLSKAITGLYLGTSQLQLSNPLTAGLTILNHFGKSGDFPMTLGLDIVISNPGKIAAKIGRFDVALAIDGNADKLFTPNEQIEIQLHTNAHPQDIVKRQTSAPEQLINPTVITIEAGKQMTVPIVVVVPNVKSQFKDQAQLTALYRSAINNDRSRIQLKIRPYMGNIALSPWIEIK